MKGARSVSVAAALGNLLQGWDNAAVAGALLYLRVEFNLEENPTLEGLVVAATLIGAVTSTAVAGPAADSLGRRFMLIVAAAMFAISALVMVWSPTIYVLIVGRFLVGTSIGLAATIVPILISESAPTEIRGQLATLPQLMGSSGLFLAYCFVFGLSLLDNPSWRMILGVIFLPAALYFGLCLFYLPESPRWLVSKGRMLEASQVLQGLRGHEDVSGELALLVEGLGVGVDTSLEEWLVKPAEISDMLDTASTDDGQISLFGPGGPDEEIAWVAQPLKSETGPLLKRQRSNDSHNMSLVSLMGSLHPLTDLSAPDVVDSEVRSRRTSYAGDADPEAGFESVGYSSDIIPEDEEENRDGADWEEGNGGLSSPLLRSLNVGQTGVGDWEDGGLSSPLLRKFNASSKTNVFARKGSSSGSLHSAFRGLSRSSSKTVEGMFGETVGSVGVGGGWQLAWRTDGEDGRYERVFLRQENNTSHMSLPGVGTNFNSDGDAFPAVALVGPSVQFSREKGAEHPVGPATVNPHEAATKGPAWSELADVGVRRALTVGVGLQFLQQFCGINAVLYFTPQILKSSGADKMAGSIGLSGDSASILMSAFTCLMMLPCIFVAMWLMDRAGRRQLLLTTLPILGFALVMVILVGSFVPPGIFQAIGSFLGVSLFICSFVTGFGPIPNILCSEIFPTRVRGIAIGITAATMWLCNVIVSYAFPIANAKFGLVGVFFFFAVMSVIAWFFVFFKVPETKGLPLEIICEFFAMTGPSSAPKKQQPVDFEEPIKSV